MELFLPKGNIVEVAFSFAEPDGQSAQIDSLVSVYVPVEFDDVLALHQFPVPGSPGVAKFAAKAETKDPNGDVYQIPIDVVADVAIGDATEPRTFTCMAVVYEQAEHMVQQLTTLGMNRVAVIGVTPIIDS
jgi:hypothetical protein